MKIASVAEVKARLSSYLKASAQGPVVVTRNGKAVAVLIGVEDDDEVERLFLAHSRKLRAILDAADRRIDEGAGIGHEAFWQQVDAANRARGRNGSGGKRRTKRGSFPGRQRGFSMQSLEARMSLPLPGPGRAA